MFWLLRRMLWFGTGAGVGFGGAMWIRSRVRRAVARVAPDHVVAEAAEGARRVGGRVGGDLRQAGSRMREALDEGRTTMRDREVELHGQLLPDAPRQLPREKGRLMSREKSSGRFGVSGAALARSDDRRKGGSFQGRRTPREKSSGRRRAGR